MFIAFALILLGLFMAALFGVSGYLSLRSAGLGKRTADTPIKQVALRSNLSSGIAMGIWMIGWPVSMIQLAVIQNSHVGLVCNALIFCAGAIPVVIGDVYGITLAKLIRPQDRAMVYVLGGVIAMVAFAFVLNVFTIVRYAGDIVGWPLAGLLVSVLAGGLLARQVYSHFLKQERQDYFMARAAAV